MDKISRDGDDQHNREKSKGEQEEETKNMFPFPKIFSFADTTDILLMVLGTTTAIASGMAIPLMTIIGGSLVNSFADAKDTKDMLNKVSKVALEFVSLGVGAGLASFFEVACWTVTGERQAARIRSLYLEAILRQDIAFFDQETKTGEVIERISRDISLIQDAISDKVGKFIQFTTTFLGGFIVAFTKGWLLSLVMLTSIPPIAISAAVFLIILGKISSRRQAAYSQAGNVAEQTISLIRTVASFTGEKQAIDKYDKYLTSAYKSGIQEGLVCAFGHSFPLSMTYLTYALGTWFGARMIIDKGYNAGDVINVIIALLMGAMALGQAFSCLGAFAAGKAATLKIFETINRKPHIDSYDTSSGKTFDDIRGDVELKDVYFSYPTRSDEKILNGFSLRMLSGMTLALVGQSGSGKSTVISLIERFYDPQAGEILIDGINLKEFQLLWIRKRIGLVSQEPVLFDSSIKDNIGYGKDDATLQEIRVATELANAAKFIDELPLGLDTLVGERGTQLSGGQKQRIAIARAILKDPRILLLDEATSALDSESEKLVQEALDGVMVNRTTLIVAHRLSTIRKADMIVVVHQGKVVEKGSHLELLEDPDGEYSQLIRLQENIKSSNDNVKQESKVEQDRHFGLQRSVSHGQPTHDIPSSTTKFDFPTRLGPQKVDPQDRDLVQPKQNHEIPFLRLAYLNKPELPILLLGTIFAAINGTLFPAFAVMFSSVFKIFYEPPSLLQNDARFWALMFVTLSVISFIAISAKTLFFSIAGCKLIKRIRARCFEKVVHMEIGWFDEPEHSSGAISARLSTDAAIVPGLIGGALSLLVQNVTTLIVGIGIAFEANWQLALITLFLLPLLGVNAWAEMKFLTGFGADAKMMYGEASRVVSNAIGNIRTVVSFSAERKVMKLYENKCRAQTNIGIKQGLIRGISFGASFFIVFSVYATIFYAGARLIHDGKLTIPMFFRVFLVLTVTAMGVSHSISLGPDYGPAKASVVSIFKILDQKVKEDSNEDKSGITLKDVRGEIEFRHVSFKYPIRPDVQIFHDFCLSINSGKTIALVGESGSGKSTVISLLQRFYDHDSGQITLDGIEIQKFQLRWLRQQMGLVSQEPILFNDTIRANIAYGKEAGEATEMDIIAASEQANAHTFVSGLQQGYNTAVGECGIQLSGGQKQRVAIARVILKSPKILLLDEATSALDAESEQMVQHALDQAMVNRTTIVVAHRLTTIRNVDLIAVVKNGIIVEKGNHDTLMSIKDGVYASLVAIQMDVSTN